MALNASSSDSRRILALVVPVAALLAAIAFRRAPGVGAAEPVDVGSQRHQQDDTASTKRAEEADLVSGAAPWASEIESTEIEVIGSRAGLPAARPPLRFSIRGVTEQISQRTSHGDCILPDKAGELGQDGAPPDVPWAFDDDPPGVPGHGCGDDREILFAGGIVEVFDVGNPGWSADQLLLVPAPLNQGVFYVEPPVPVVRIQDLDGRLNQGITYREPPATEVQAPQTATTLNQGVDYTAP